MRGLILLFLFLLLCQAKCQNDSFNNDIRNCIVNENDSPNIEVPNAILVISLFQKKNVGVYAFRNKGPHQLNRLLIKENEVCHAVNNDSSSNYFRQVIARFAIRNKLSSQDETQLQKKVQEFIIDFKESDYIK